MKEFMMLFRNEKMEGGEQPSAEQMQAVMKEWQTWIKGIAEKGNYSSTNLH
jgi:Skp family chaperone for outer membrane proteins